MADDTFRPPRGIYGYARVSRAPDANLDVQQRTIAGYAQMHGPTVERVFVERGVCPGREALIPGASAPARSAAREPGPARRASPTRWPLGTVPPSSPSLPLIALHLAMRSCVRSRSAAPRRRTGG